MNKNQKLILEWLRVYMEVNELGTFSAIADLQKLYLANKLVKDVKEACIYLSSSEEREILAELAKE